MQSLLDNLSKKVQQVLAEQQQSPAGPTRFTSVLETVAGGIASLQKQFQVTIQLVHADGTRSVVRLPVVRRWW